MELIQHLHTGLGTVASLVKLILEFISVFCVVLGMVTALAMAFGNLFRTGRFISRRPSVRLKFGTWLLMALEFQLGADIVATTVNPSLQSLGELAILAAIRTFLNFFLQRELEAEAHRATTMAEPMATAEGEGLRTPDLSCGKKDCP
jgi:uncharacterized membrane protein